MTYSKGAGLHNEDTSTTDYNLPISAELLSSSAALKTWGRLSGGVVTATLLIRHSACGAAEKAALLGLPLTQP